MVKKFDFYINERLPLLLWIKRTSTEYNKSTQKELDYILRWINKELKSYIKLYTYTKRIAR